MTSTSVAKSPVIGVLALQGDFAAHGRMLEQLSVAWRPVRLPRDLEGLSGLILPGGESTTMLKGIADAHLEPALFQAAERKLPVLATCAGAILLARDVDHPKQKSFGWVDIDVHRNGYGRQVSSFIATEPVLDLGDPPLEMVFIRAPLVTRTGPSVRVLARHQGHAVLMRQESQYLVTTFHPELTSDLRVHRHFYSMVKP